MKIVYSEIFRKTKASNLHSLLKILPKTVFVAYIIQYKKLAWNVKEELAKSGFKILGFEQVLGCSKLKPKENILLIGGGKFHALNLLNYAKRVIVFNGEQVIELGLKDKAEIEKSRKAKITQFLHANNIGLIVSTKQGQFNLKEAARKEKELESKFPGKKFYIFLVETLQQSELENFPIDFWINFSCPGIEYDSKKVANIDTLQSIIKK